MSKFISWFTGRSGTDDDTSENQYSDNYDNYQQQMTQMQIPAELPMMTSTLSAAKILENNKIVSQALTETRNKMVENLNIIQSQGESLSLLIEKGNALELSSQDFLRSQKQLSKAMVPPQIASAMANISQLVQKIHLVTSIDISSYTNTLQINIGNIDQLLAHMDSIPPPDPADDDNNGGSERTHAKLDDLMQKLGKVNEVMKVSFDMVEERGDEIDQLLLETDRIVELSKQYLDAAKILNRSSSSNIYWIFIIDIIASVLGLVGAGTSGTNELATKASNIARVAVSLLVLFASLFGGKSSIPTGVFFGTIYIIISWLISITSFITELVRYIKGVKWVNGSGDNQNESTFKKTVRVVNICLLMLMTVFITIFGVKTYLIGSAVSQLGKMYKGYLEINRWYLVGVSIISLFIAGLKIYISFSGDSTLFRSSTSMGVLPEPQVPPTPPASPQVIETPEKPIVNIQTPSVVTTPPLINSTLTTTTQPPVVSLISI